MTSTAPRHRARHRAPLSLRDRVARAWLAASAVPVGALAGCATLGVAASIDQPAVGLLGLGAAMVPLSIAGWRSRLAGADPAHGRRAVGRPVLAVAPESLPVTRLEAAGADQPVEAAAPLPIVLDVPDLASLQAATGTDPSRVFTLAAGGSEVEVVVLTREERAARDLAVLQEMGVAEPLQPAAA